jgi:hypothetical protein
MQASQREDIKCTCVFLIGLGMLLFNTVSRPALWPTLHTVQWVPGVKWPEREVSLSPTISVDVKNVLSNTSTPPIRLHGVVLRDAELLLPFFAFTVLHLIVLMFRWCACDSKFISSALSLFVIERIKYDVSNLFLH